MKKTAAEVKERDSLLARCGPIYININCVHGKYTGNTRCCIVTNTKNWILFLIWLKETTGMGR